MRGFLGMLLTLPVLAGCSTIIEGRHQELSINSEPPGAACKLEREGAQIGAVAATPGTVLVEKTKNDILITCEKPGYQTASLKNHSDSAAATAGNILLGLLGGPIAWGIDSATGADNKYDSPVSLTLAPEAAPASPASSPQAAAPAATGAGTTSTQ